MDWSFGDVLWTMFALYFWVMLIAMFVAAFADIFRRDDLSGGGKALWIAVLVILPFLGILIYVASRPSGAARSGAPMTRVDQPSMPLH
jgi:hypothetical protein